MPIAYAMLLDGGFVRRKLGTTQNPVDAAGIIRFVQAARAMPCLQDLRLHRIYYYDSKPIEGTANAPLGGPVVDFGGSPVAARNKSIQASLHREPYFALRYGELHHEGWHLKPRILTRPGPNANISANDLKPSIRQKGVDMRIGLDIASLTLEKHAQVIVLVTADSDFVPAMKFARREGAQLFLVTLGHGIKESMREHADLVIDQYPLPT